MRRLSVEDTLGEGQVGPQAITSEVIVSIRVSTCSSRVKFAYIKNESSPNVVSIGYSTNAPQGRMIVCQKNVHS